MKFTLLLLFPTLLTLVAAGCKYEPPCSTHCDYAARRIQHCKCVSLISALSCKKKQKEWEDCRAKHCKGKKREELGEPLTQEEDKMIEVQGERLSEDHETSGIPQDEKRKQDIDTARNDALEPQGQDTDDKTQDVHTNTNADATYPPGQYPPPAHAPRKLLARQCQSYRDPCHPDCANISWVAQYCSCNAHGPGVCKGSWDSLVSTMVLESVWNHG
ncbi:hypothetical protein BDV95DRAFT_217800 [Massariosphaeria phaeospora]|uniref:Extracellular membrane protein CFEM domain-containing protein n=1 Tax=Massariosphaeria phaeospora TaxID=100035 RepID=A0A7C8ML67_9PLEO|nr:hypothetical protein BDV95DRAFT_217800 [Massariosphaeria phaeospora]